MRFSDLGAAGGAFAFITWITIFTIGCVVAVLWTLLPFAIFGIKRRLEMLSRQIDVFLDQQEKRGHVSQTDRGTPSPKLPARSWLRWSRRGQGSPPRWM